MYTNWDCTTEPPFGYEFTVNFNQMFVHLSTPISQLMVAWSPFTL